MSHLIPSSQITNKIGNYYCQGCIYHQKHIFKFHKSSSLSASLSSDMMASSFTLSLLPESNDKLSHLKAIYKKWFNNTITTVTSHRRGIEYQTKYQHLDCDLFNGIPRRYSTYFVKSILTPLSFHQIITRKKP
ncbi:hypothetical protein RclHR1_08150007 [Rhizophagus clarus]|uniref:Uncharacterized protein n=1 Tax=Rhizophagus clarus TaxID=94130 RepID=A0A2Z6S005_9GLOM|nr:hypothetical protein RclHR1_08150007 [Rhizophagus clarus]